MITIVVLLVTLVSIVSSEGQFNEFAMAGTWQLDCMNIEDNSNWKSTRVRIMHTGLGDAEHVSWFFSNEGCGGDTVYTVRNFGSVMLGSTTKDDSWAQRQIEDDAYLTDVDYMWKGSHWTPGTTSAANTLNTWCSNGLSPAATSGTATDLLNNTSCGDWVTAYSCPSQYSSVSFWDGKLIWGGVSHSCSEEDRPRQFNRDRAMWRAIRNSDIQGRWEAPCSSKTKQTVAITGQNWMQWTMYYADQACTTLLGIESLEAMYTIGKPGAGGNTAELNLFPYKSTWSSLNSDLFTMMNHTTGCSGIIEVGQSKELNIDGTACSPIWPTSDCAGDFHSVQLGWSNPPWGRPTMKTTRRGGGDVSVGDGTPFKDANVVAPVPNCDMGSRYDVTTNNARWITWTRLAITDQDLWGDWSALVCNNMEIVSYSFNDGRFTRTVEKFMDDMCKKPAMTASYTGTYWIQGAAPSMTKPAAAAFDETNMRWMPERGGPVGTERNRDDISYLKDFIDGEVGSGKPDRWTAGLFRRDSAARWFSSEQVKLSFSVQTQQVTVLHGQAMKMVPPSCGSNWELGAAMNIGGSCPWAACTGASDAVGFDNWGRLGFGTNNVWGDCSAENTVAVHTTPLYRLRRALPFEDSAHLMMMANHVPTGKPCNVVKGQLESFRDGLPSECDENGMFKPTQMSGNEWWCVDILSGQAQPWTRVTDMQTETTHCFPPSGISSGDLIGRWAPGDECRQSGDMYFRAFAQFGVRTLVIVRNYYSDSTCTGSLMLSTVSSGIYKLQPTNIDYDASVDYGEQWADLRFHVASRWWWTAESDIWSEFNTRTDASPVPKIWNTDVPQKINCANKMWDSTHQGHDVLLTGCKHGNVVGVNANCTQETNAIRIGVQEGQISLAWWSTENRLTSGGALIDACGGFINTVSSTQWSRTLTAGALQGKWNSVGCAEGVSGEMSVHGNWWELNLAVRSDSSCTSEIQEMWHLEGTYVAGVWTSAGGRMAIDMDVAEATLTPLTAHRAELYENNTNDCPGDYTENEEIDLWSRNCRGFSNSCQHMKLAVQINVDENAVSFSFPNLSDEEPSWAKECISNRQDLLKPNTNQLTLHGAKPTWYMGRWYQSCEEIATSGTAEKMSRMRELHINDGAVQQNTNYYWGTSCETKVFSIMQAGWMEDDSAERVSTDGKTVTADYKIWYTTVIPWTTTADLNITQPTTAPTTGTIARWLYDGNDLWETCLNSYGYSDATVGNPYHLGMETDKTGCDVVFRCGLQGEQSMLRSGNELILSDCDNEETATFLPTWSKPSPDGYVSAVGSRQYLEVCSRYQCGQGGSCIANAVGKPMCYCAPGQTGTWCDRMVAIGDGIPAPRDTLSASFARFQPMWATSSVKVPVTLRGFRSLNMMSSTRVKLSASGLNCAGYAPGSDVEHAAKPMSARGVGLVGPVTSTRGKYAICIKDHMQWEMTGATVMIGDEKPDTVYFGAGSCQGALDRHNGEGGKPFCGCYYIRNAAGHPQGTNEELSFGVRDLPDHPASMEDAVGNPYTYRAQFVESTYPASWFMNTDRPVHVVSGCCARNAKYWLEWVTSKDGTTKTSVWGMCSNAEDESDLPTIWPDEVADADGEESP